MSQDKKEEKTAKEILHETKRECKRVVREDKKRVKKEDGRGNPENLVSLKDLPTEKQRKIASMGGKASGQKKRERKALDEAVELAIQKHAKGEDLTYFERMVLNVLTKAADGDSWAVEYVTKIILRNDHKFSTEKKERSIWRKLIDGKITEKEASYLFERYGIKLPRSVELQIMRQDPEPVDPSGGVFATMSDEEMEARHKERSEEINAQREGLSERRAKMDELHKSAPDTFAKDNHGQA